MGLGAVNRGTSTVIIDPLEINRHSIRHRLKSLVGGRQLTTLTRSHNLRTTGNNILTSTPAVRQLNTGSDLTGLNRINVVDKRSAFDNLRLGHTSLATLSPVNVAPTLFVSARQVLLLTRILVVLRKPVILKRARVTVRGTRSSICARVSLSTFGGCRRLSCRRILLRVDNRLHSRCYQRHRQSRSRDRCAAAADNICFPHEFPFKKRQ